MDKVVNICCSIGLIYIGYKLCEKIDLDNTEIKRRIELYDRRSEINNKQIILYADKVLDKYRHINTLLGNYKELKEDKDLLKIRESLEKLFQ